MKGQGIIEAIYSIGVLGMVLTGVLVLILMTSTYKKNDFDRKKAMEMGTMIVEELINKSNNDQQNFWNLNNTLNQTKTGFDNYIYSVKFTNITNDVNYPNCGVGVTNCAEVEVKIDWQGKNPQSLTFNRFFIKNGY